MPVSWLTPDALGDLLAAVTDALGPVGRGECNWELEPGEYAWSFRRRGTEIDVHIDYYDEWRHFELAPGDEWVLEQTPTPIFDAAAPAVNVATAVVDASERLLERHGDAGYREKWDAAPFPRERLARLQTALATLTDHD